MAEPYECYRDGFLISTDPARLDVSVIHGFLRTSYWSSNIPRTVVEKAIQHSLCFGLYADDRQIGFARVISDHATFAYLADVFVLEECRGRGLAIWLIECIRAHPDLRGLRRWLLATRDAHALYRRFGFRELAAPERSMEIHDPDVYSRAKGVE